MTEILITIKKNYKILKTKWSKVSKILFLLLNKIKVVANKVYKKVASFS